MEAESVNPGSRSYTARLLQLLQLLLPMLLPLPLPFLVLFRSGMHPRMAHDSSHVQCVRDIAWVKPGSPNWVFFFGCDFFHGAIRPVTWEC